MATRLGARFGVSGSSSVRRGERLLSRSERRAFARDRGGVIRSGTRTWAAGAAEVGERVRAGEAPARGAGAEEKQPGRLRRGEWRSGETRGVSRGARERYFTTS